MNEEIMNEIQPVRPKDQFTFSCRQCGACCRNIEGCVMVESLDATVWPATSGQRVSPSKE